MESESESERDLWLLFSFFFFCMILLVGWFICFFLVEEFLKFICMYVSCYCEVVGS